jgi:hypothetical protein
MVPVIKGNRGIRVAADCGWANPRDAVGAMVCRPTYFSTVDNWWVATLFCSFRNYFLCLYRPGSFGKFRDRKFRGSFESFETDEISFETDEITPKCI